VKSAYVVLSAEDIYNILYDDLDKKRPVLIYLPNYPSVC